MAKEKIFSLRKLIPVIQTTLPIECIYYYSNTINYFKIFTPVICDIYRLATIRRNPRLWKTIRIEGYSKQGLSISVIKCLTSISLGKLNP
jgi:hypothetical protein